MTGKKWSPKSLFFRFLNRFRCGFLRQDRIGDLFQFVDFVRSFLINCIYCYAEQNNIIWHSTRLSFRNRKPGCRFLHDARRWPNYRQKQCSWSRLPWAITEVFVTIFTQSIRKQKWYRAGGRTKYHTPYDPIFWGVWMWLIFEGGVYTSSHTKFHRDWPSQLIIMA